MCTTGTVLFSTPKKASGKYRSTHLGKLDDICTQWYQGTVIDFTVKYLNTAVFEGLISTALGTCVADPDPQDPFVLGRQDPDPDPDQLVKGTDPDPSIIKQKK